MYAAGHVVDSNLGQDESLLGQESLAKAFRISRGRRMVGEWHSHYPAKKSTSTSEAVEESVAPTLSPSNHSSLSVVPVLCQVPSQAVRCQAKLGSKRELGAKLLADFL